MKVEGIILKKMWYNFIVAYLFDTKSIYDKKDYPPKCL